MDLIKLLSNPMQGMMGQELDNVFKRLQGGGQQQMPQMQYEPEAYQSPFGDMMMQEPQQEQMADQNSLQQVHQDLRNQRKQQVAPHIAHLVEGFAPEEAEGWMDAFVDAIDDPYEDSFANNDFLKTVIAESTFTPDEAEEFKNTLRELRFNPFRDDPGAVAGDIYEGMQDSLEGLTEEEADAEVERAFEEQAAEYNAESEAALDTLFSQGAQEQEAEIDQQLTLGSGNPDDEDGEEIVDENGIPADGVSFDKMAAAEKNAVSKQMREESTKAQSLIKAHRTLSEMKKLVKEHPNMADDMAAVFAEPNEDPGVIKQFMQKYFANKKELAAYQKFTKLSSELVLDAGSALGGRNFTDAKMKLIQRSKPSGRMTDDALNYVIDHMMYDWEPAQAYADAIEKGRVGRYQPRMDMEAYRGKGKGKKAKKAYEDMSDEELEAAIMEAENG